MKKKVDEIKMAMKEKDFSKFGEILEEEAINMHLIMMTSKPALYYWTPETLKIMLKVIEWRNQGLENYFTIDAGPNMHIICREQNVNKVKAKLVRLAGVKQIIINHPAEGARIVKF